MAPADLEPADVVARTSVAAICFAVLLGGVAFVGWVFDTIDTNRGFARWDERAAAWGAANATESTTAALDGFTQLGGTPLVVTLLVFVSVFLYRRRGSWAGPVYLLVTFLGVAGLNNLLKLIVDRERPDVSQLASHAGSSFPSGHTATAAACWAALAYLAGRNRSRLAKRALLLGGGVVAITVASTRVLLGVHWVTDVVAGLVVGWSWWAIATALLAEQLGTVDVSKSRTSDSQ